MAYMIPYHLTSIDPRCRKLGSGFHSIEQIGRNNNCKLVIKEINPMDIKLQDNAIAYASMTKEEKYKSILPQIEALVMDEKDIVANMANVSAVLKQVFNFFWVGFYRITEDDMVLAPFQGPVACTRLPKGKGVCWRAAELKESVIVPNVDEFSGHIACASETKSEIVIPILKGNEVIYVLDVDSEHLDYFDNIDRDYLEQISLLL